MMAPPKREQSLQAFSGGSIANIVFRAMAGPFAGGFEPGEPYLDQGVWPERSANKVMIVLLVALLAIAVSILFLVPAREVTQPPRRSQFLWEILFPGTLPVWSFLGGLVAVAWCYFLLQWILLFFRGSSSPITCLAIPSAHAFGMHWDNAEIRELINPGWIWIYAVPALLFAVNLILVMRRRRIEVHSTSV